MNAKANSPTIHLDLTTIDELDPEAVSAVTHENFGTVVAELTTRKLDREFAEDHSNHRRAWEEV